MPDVKGVEGKGTQKEHPIRTVLLQSRLTTAEARWFEAMMALLMLRRVGVVQGAVCRAVPVALFVTRPGRI